MSKEIKNGWRKHKTSDMVFKYADCFYQKCFYDFGEEKVCSEIVEYGAIPKKDIKKSWELHIYVEDDLSITGDTIKAVSYSYDKLDFKKMEQKARKMIKALIKKK